MFKYIKIIILAIVASLLLAACSNGYFVGQKIDAVLVQNRKSPEAEEWLIYNSELVAPVLADRLSSRSNKKVNDTKELLMIMGKDGVSIVLSDFQSLNDDGKAALAEVLVAQNSKDAVMQLLAMSSLNGGFDISVDALVQMGDTPIPFLESLLNQDAYYECVNAALAKNSQRVIEDIIPLVNSDDSYLQKRSLEILSFAQSDVVAPLLEMVLSDSFLTNEKAIRISNIALYNNKETAINEIINIAAQGNADPVASATMLYELSKDDDIGQIFEKCAKSANAANTNEMLKEYVNQAGVARVVQTALSSQSLETITSISFALSTFDHSIDTFIEILNSVRDTDSADTPIYELSDKLIYDPILSAIAQATIAIDANAMYTSLQMEGANPKQIGEAISQTSGNETIVRRFDTMLNSMDSNTAKSTMIVLAYGEDAVYPKLVWNRYISADYNLSASAMDVILEATSSGIKFQYTDMDFLPYADKLVADLKSGNSEIKNKAIQILNKIPEGVENHEFYKKVYSGYKDQSLFTILCWHYAGEGAKTLDLQVDGLDEIITEISYEIKSIKVTKIDSNDFIDYRGMIKQSINTLGLKVVDNARVKLVITINETPLSRHYSGLVGNSYMGANCTTQIEVYIDGEKTKTVSGYFEILPPAKKPVDDDVSEYKDKPTDAPLETPFITSYIQALYKTFGEQVLFGTYQYDRLATFEAGKGIWIN
ncbi:MAG: hypothetical protein AB1Z23_05170 [Eubacteriales bacterium]